MAVQSQTCLAHQPGVNVSIQPSWRPDVNLYARREDFPEQESEKSIAFTYPRRRGSIESGVVKLLFGSLQSGKLFPRVPPVQVP